MKILHIISGDGGGISTYVKNILEYNNTDYSFTVLSFSEYSSEFRELAKQTNTELISMPRPKKTSYLVFINFIKMFFKEHFYDIVECHIPGIHMIPFAYYAKVNGIQNFVHHSHQTMSSLRYTCNNIFLIEFKEYIDSIVNRMLSKVYVACGKKALYYGFRSLVSNKSFVIFNSVDLQKYNTIRNSEIRVDPNVNIVRVGHIGRHSLQKNLHFIIELAEYLKINSQVNFEFHMFGNGELSENLCTEIESKGLKDMFVLYGRVANIQNYFNNFDVMILPSFSEGLPTVVIEAQAASTPCLLSNTITDEVDLGLDMVNYLPISETSENYELWGKKLIEMTQRYIPSKDIIFKRISEKKFDITSFWKEYDKLIEFITNYK